MTHTLDCCGLSCKEALLHTQTTLSQMNEGILEIKLNSPSSIRKIRHYAQKHALHYRERKGDSTTLIAITAGVKPHTETDNMAGAASFWTLITGALVTALLASTCCLAPLLFLLFGITAGSLGFLHIFAPYHTFFTALAVSVIGYLWYYYFRTVRKKTLCEGWACRYYLRYLSIGTLLVCILLSYQYWAIYLIG